METILLIEDDQDILENLTEYFELEDYESLQQVPCPRKLNREEYFPLLANSSSQPTASHKVIPVGFDQITEMIESR